MMDKPQTDPARLTTSEQGKAMGSATDPLPSSLILPRHGGEPPAQEVARLRKSAAGIYRGFESESLNGVVCSIPDTGLDTKPHRTWCARCQRLWLSLKTLGETEARADTGARQTSPRKCAHGDVTCPCQDGDPCNHEPLPGEAGARQTSPDTNTKETKEI